MITIDKLDRNPVLAEYDNGNCHVKLFSDGTKIRTCDDEVALPLMPESIDLKITDYCDVGCPFCHEGSSKAGKAASPEVVRCLIDELRVGCELAIGGGDPLSHQDIRSFLYDAAEVGLISNMTVNMISIADPLALRRVTGWMRDKLLFGIGISQIDSSLLEILEIDPSNVVVHKIAGIDNPQEVLHTSKKYKTLILGFKEIGRGKSFAEGTHLNTDQWKFWLPEILAQPNTIISFDNLAIEQLGVKNLFDQATWDEMYMGDEGEFTMYIDAVKEEYAISSADERYPIAGQTVQEMFADVRKKSGHMAA